jgi:hypothetical protein
MKKGDLKNLIKPIVKECIQEVLLEEGLLSNVVSEVAKGLQVQATITEHVESAPSRPAPKPRPRDYSNDRKKLLDAIGKDAYNGVDLFEGTTPAPAPSTGQGQGPLDGVAPNDPGVDISGIFSGHSAKIWQKLSGKD